MERCVKAGAFEPFHPGKQHQCFVARRPLIDSARKQVACALDISRFVCFESPVQQLLGFALPLGDRGAGAVNVRAGPVVIAVEKHDTRPDVDRLLVVSGEVVIEAGNEKFFDARGALGVG
jgi:hypothetical protein